MANAQALAQNHPEQFVVKVSCSCGNKFVLMCSRPIKELNVEKCNVCHMAYTGQQRKVELKASQRFADKYKGQNSRFISSNRQKS